MLSVSNLPALTIKDLKEATKQDKNLTKLIQTVERKNGHIQFQRIYIQQNGQHMTYSKRTQDLCYQKHRHRTQNSSRNGLYKTVAKKQHFDAERLIRNCTASVLNQPLHEDQPPRHCIKLGIDLVGSIMNASLP